MPDASCAIGDEVEAEIFRNYCEVRNEILRHAATSEMEVCLAQAFDLWMFMNRFRNCDLGIYFDEDLHSQTAGAQPGRKKEWQCRFR